MDKPRKNIRKARIQVQVDPELKSKAEDVLSSLGMNSTTAITMLFKRIVATDSYPVNLKLTEREVATKNLLEATKDLPVKDISRTELEKMYEDDDDDGY
ncbi:type II toxin-antitoxin system RelB/DinJ family antitoxin [Companilactobacillus sp. FL22-1]|uniref:type II toxin-antitoxin system RelB/DinJ family antitoxin n=1 Tax=Companilactobacillus sp. FL22-1 TaxID=3373892 RepID=UPI003754FCB8